MILELLLSIIIPSAAAADVRLQGVLTTQLSPPTLSAQLKEGFHFNDKAPQLLLIDGQKLKPSLLAGREAKFEALPRSWRSATANLYICDDAVTFCALQKIELLTPKGQVTSTANLAPARPSAAPHLTSPESKSPAPSARGEFDRNGFIENDFAGAISLAKKQGKLILADFSARWCPGCVRYETETFSTPGFKKQSAPYIKLKLDADRFSNSVHSAKFKITSIPTLLVFNADQEEISRLVDYQAPEVVSRFFESIQQDPAPIARVVAQADTKPPTQDPGALLKLGRRRLSAGRAGEAIPFLTQIQPPPPELLEARVESAAEHFQTDPKTLDAYTAALRSAISQEPGSSRSIPWRTRWVGLLKDKALIQTVTADGTTLADHLLADPVALRAATQTDNVGEFTGFERLLVATYRADLIGESQPPDSQRTIAAWKKAAEVGKSLRIPPQLDGVWLRRLIVETAAKNFDDANELASAILRRQPGNGDVQRRKLKILVELKRFPEAVHLGERAIRNAYGRNEFWVAEYLAKAYLGAGDQRVALSLIDRFLSRDEAEWPTLASTRETLKNLRKVAAASTGS